MRCACAQGDEEDHSGHYARSQFHGAEGVPGLTPQLVRSYIDRQIEKLNESGYDATSCLIDLGDTAEAVVGRALRSKHFDCVMIGAVLRKPPQNLLLFETILNLVHALGPHAKICFNTTPTDIAEAVQRCVRREESRS